jgi:two-component system, sensor histidine kinase YesM
VFASGAVIVVCAGVLLFYGQVSRLIIERNTTYVEDVFEQVQANVEQAGLTFSRLLRTVAYNPTVQRYLLATDPLEQYELQTQLRPFLTQIVAFTSGIIDIALRPSTAVAPLSLGDAGHFIARSTQTFAAGSRPTYSGVVPYGAVHVPMRQPAFVVAVTVYSVQPNETYGAPLGEAVMIVATDAIVPRVASPSDRRVTSFYLLDRDGAVVGVGGNPPQVRELADALPEEHGHGMWSARIDGVPYLIQSAPVAVLGGTVVGLTAERLLLRDVVVLRSVMLVILVGAVMGLFVPVSLLLRTVSVPIARLTAFVSRAKGQDPRDFVERIEADGFQEMRTLAAEFNGMLDEVSRLTRRVVAANVRAYRAEILERETELGVLQGQINPHFLYNTLETMRGMALAEQGERVADVIESLGRIYKYAVKAGDLVELRLEMAILESYIHIQQVRFGERVTMRTAIEPEALTFRVPKMILQPIVENAIVHGLEHQRSGGEVVLTASVGPGAVLSVSVADTGIGMSAERLRTVRADLEGDPGFGTNGSSGRPIGLRNIRDRLVLVYGAAATISINSGTGCGTEVVLRLPREREHVSSSDR